MKEDNPRVCVNKNQGVRPAEPLSRSSVAFVVYKSIGQGSFGICLQLHN